MPKLLGGPQNTDRDSKSVLWNIFNTFLVKGGALIVGLLTTPAYMGYFEKDSVLGVWYTMLSILTWVLYFDLGIGNGLRNKLVEAIAAGDKIRQKEYVSSAYIFLSFIAAGVSTVLLLLCQVVNWNGILNISESHLSSQTLTASVTIVLGGILCQFVLRLISSIMYAIQKAFIPNLMSLCTNVIVLIYVTAACRMGYYNDIILLSWVYFFASILPMATATVFIFATRLKEIRPSIRFYRRSCAIEVFKTGSGFLILQIAGMIIGNSCVVYLITLLLGAESVVEFNVYYKIYSNVSMLFTILMTPIWSAITKAKADSRFAWIKQMMSKLRIVLTIFFLAQFLLLPIMQNVFDLWLGDQSIHVNIPVQLVFIFNNGIMMLYLFAAQVCNGLGEIRRQIKWMLTANVLLIVLSVIFTHIYPHYVSILFAQTAALVPYCFVMNVWLNKYVKIGMQGKMITDQEDAN